MKQRVGIIGVGAIGHPLATHLLHEGYSVTICPHRNYAPIEQLKRQGAHSVSNPAEVAAHSDIVLILVPDAPQVEDVCFGEQGLAVRSTREHALTVVVMSTIAPTAVQSIGERLQDLGIRVLDAPVSGGPARAATGDLTIMVGGEADVLAPHWETLRVLGSHIIHLGPLGHGAIAKVANNMIIGTLMPVLAEVLTLATKMGADVEKVREAIATSSGSNYLLEKWLPQTILQDQYEGGFALDLMLKDLQIALSTARALDVPAFATSLSAQLFTQAHGLGYGQKDYSAVSLLYQNAAQITIATGRARHRDQIITRNQKGPLL
ncbi:2-hydroxy-3-oxopropionate reductase [Ktedonobacter sp. SOSP1-52]|uniref:NAD(P)-dependent oxidoreductase n=1 Tax=Ktedonobacter sp. SOSP1-52 TaxID=2778366 RepID=UPI001915EBE1|nr:NAD(P)-dependent oxidoreductase [Ktedonobacter sp. SOSP1-52]GHO64019.1 2-hydroxy-3-oxopropionate reductase [Ktedonobacter sp. SOSP1-52]